MTYAKINLNPTNLRLDDNYVYYYVNWSRFLVSGLIPLVSLTVLNFAIYRQEKFVYIPQVSQIYSYMLSKILLSVKIFSFFFFTPFLYLYSAIDFQPTAQACIACTATFCLHVNRHLVNKLKGLICAKHISDQENQ